SNIRELLQAALRTPHRVRALVHDEAQMVHEAGSWRPELAASGQLRPSASQASLVTLSGSATIQQLQSVFSFRQNCLLLLDDVVPSPEKVQLSVSKLQLGQDLVAEALMELRDASTLHHYIVVVCETLDLC